MSDTLNAPEPIPAIPRADLAEPLGEVAGEAEEPWPRVARRARGACCPACGAALPVMVVEGAKQMSPTLRRVLAGL